MSNKFNSFSDFGKSQGFKPPQKDGGGRSDNPQYGGKSMLEKDFFELDFDYVQKAETVMKSLITKDRWGNEGFGNFTTSKIRNILSLSSEISTSVMQAQGAQLSEDLADRIRYIKVRLAYEAGREDAVKKFLEKSSLMDIVGQIGNDKKRFQRYEKYLEALVAYHRFFGGKD